jgi:hypothetical protein
MLHSVDNQMTMTTPDLKLQLIQLVDIAESRNRSARELLKVLDNTLYSEYEQGVAQVILQEMLPMYQEFVLGTDRKAKAFMRGFNG